MATVGRPAKDYKRLQISIDMEWYKKLREMKEETGQSMTDLVENALNTCYNEGTNKTNGGALYP